MNTQEILNNNQEIAEIAESVIKKIETKYDSMIAISYVIIILINLIRLYLACKDRPLLYNLIKRVTVANRLILRREINRIIPEDFTNERLLERYIIQEAKKLSEQRLQEICSKYSI